ncbi:MAG: GNAT family N-acetyltransferase [Ruminococcus sp.]|nr:GNAT family N-acetyltransferase [Ruminococcus sp.]
MKRKIMLPEIKTERLILRRFTEKDIPAACSYVGSAENTRFLICGVQSEQDYRDYIRFSAKDENYYIFAVTLKTTGALIGTADLGLIDDCTQAEIGWIIHRDCWGRGYCTEVGKALLAFAFDGLDLRRVIAHSDTENIGSWRVMEKIGMRREGCFIEGRRPYEHEPCYHGSEYAYGILSEEYFSPRADHGEKMRELLAIEYNCSPGDLSGAENVITVSASNEGRRNYGEERYFFHMASTGGNAVITADCWLIIKKFLQIFYKDNTADYKTI